MPGPGREQLEWVERRRIRMDCRVKAQPWPGSVGTACPSIGPREQERWGGGGTGLVWVFEPSALCRANPPGLAWSPHCGWWKFSLFFLTSPELTHPALLQSLCLKTEGEAWGSPHCPRLSCTGVWTGILLVFKQAGGGGGFGIHVSSPPPTSSLTPAQLHL